MSTKNKKWYGTEDLELRMGKRTVGAFLRSWRMSHELSQVDFARKLKMSRANLCDIEMGRKGVSPEKAAEIAKTLGYSINVLVEMAIEEQLAAGGLKYTVTLRAVI
ncbi:MAG: helix-turn-helix domain-containing protein [Ignavibacteriales bacterium]|nr:helix-turn-helix domain-containing protein [Ignavibacteriales bacterium]